MGISSLGVGSSVLTQDVIDQLKAADESQFVAPLTKKISAEKSKSGQMDIVNALMDNLSESTGAIAEFGLFNTRTANASGTAVEVSANEGSDIQDFSITVTDLATKQIEQSGSFSSETDAIATGSGQLQLSVGSSNFTFDYDNQTTLTNLKDEINKKAGTKVNASIVQIASGDYRLFLSAVETGTSQTISLTDVAGAGETLKSALTTEVSNVQTAQDASFTYNGQTITRESNTVSDLLSGVTLTLKEAGSSQVSVKQDVEGIEGKINSFVEKFNSAITELSKMTKSSQDESERGVFSSEGTIKTMKRTLESMISTVGEGAGRLDDYGFSINRDGTMSFDKSVFEEKLTENPENVQAFFSGGTYLESDGSSVELTGAFDELKSIVDVYAKYNGSLDQLKTSFTNRISALEDQQSLATQRLTAKYEIMAKRFSAYDAMISKINNASTMFVQMANAQLNAQNQLQ
jgi:flagellar hook-associated protein 2